MRKLKQIKKVQLMQMVLATKGQRKSQICEEGARSDFDKSQFTKFDTCKSSKIFHELPLFHLSVLSALKISVSEIICPVILDIPTLHCQ